MEGIVQLMKNLLSAFGENSDLYTLGDSAILAVTSKNLDVINTKALEAATTIEELFNIDLFFNE